VHKLLAGAIAAIGVPLVAFTGTFLAFTQTQSADAGAVTDIPPSLVGVYQSAAQTCPGLSWTVLAAIGFVESHHGEGRLDPATGEVLPPILGPALDGSGGTARLADPGSPDGWAHAQGLMQFLPTTWATWARLAPGRPAGAVPDINNAWDAIYTAAAYLCGPTGRVTALNAAILRYNPSTAYLQAVLAKAAEYNQAVNDAQAGSTRLVWPFRTKSASQFSQVDQGWDLNDAPGAPVRAITTGTIVHILNDPAGFGAHYPIEHADAPIGGPSQEIYYGHVTAIVSIGQHVTAGQNIAYTHTSSGDGNGGPGHLEIGFADAVGNPIRSGGGPIMRRLLLEANP